MIAGGCSGRSSQETEGFARGICKKFAFGCVLNVALNIIRTTPFKFLYDICIIVVCDHRLLRVCVTGSVCSFQHPFETL